MFYYMHNNTNYQCKICWNKALTFGVGSIQLSFRIYHCVHPIHANMFSIQMLLYTFQSNCAEGLHFSAFIISVTIFVKRNNSTQLLFEITILELQFYAELFNFSDSHMIILNIIFSKILNLRLTGIKYLISSIFS